MADLKNKVKCPVCDMDVTTDKLRAEYKGHSYYFCSENDKKMFIGNPEKYLSKAAKAA